MPQITPHRPKNHPTSSSRSPIGKHRKLRSFSQKELVNFIGKIKDSESTLFKNPAIGIRSEL